MMIADRAVKRTRFATCVLVAVAAGVAALLPAGDAAAQYAELDKDAWVGVVTGDDVYLRSGAANSYYAFGTLEQGAMVKVLEEKYNWARIAAVGPAFEDLFGYIKQSADEPPVLRLNAEGTRGVTLGPINLIAPNIETAGAVQHSWKPVVRLQPDRELVVRKTIETDGQIVYAVALPQDATGWMSMAYLRKASAQEQQKWQRMLKGETPKKSGDAKNAGTEAPAKDATKRPTDAAGEQRDVPNRVLPREQPQRVPAQQPADNRPAPAGQATEQTTQEQTTRDVTTGSSSLDATPVYEDGTVGESEPAADDAAQQPAETNTPRPDRTDAQQAADEKAGDSPDAAADAEGEGKPAPPLDPKQKLEALEGAFERLREEPIETAEVDELRRLYVDLIEQAEDNRQVRLFAKARAEQLRIWSDLQTRKRELARLRSRMEMAGDDVQSVKHSLLSSGNYTVVGRVAASTVYDGTKLPRLYRVQDPGTGRTVAYLRPDREMDLVGMLGQLVGIVGAKEYDGSLGLHIIAPEQIDLLAPRQGSGQTSEVSDQT